VWLLVEGFLEHWRDGREVFGFFRTFLLEPDDVDSALELGRGREYPGNDFLPGLPLVWSVFAGETPWSRRFEVYFDDDDDDPYSLRALHRDWNDEGIGLGQVAVELATGDGGSPTALERSYDVPAVRRSPALARRAEEVDGHGGSHAQRCHGTVLPASAQGITSG
jgi:hypothetical protein